MLFIYSFILWCATRFAGSSGQPCTNATGGFSCPSGECIPKIWICDGMNDCGDMADEKNCTSKCSNRRHFECPSSLECIPRDWVCDGEKDCADGSDEMQDCAFANNVTSCEEGRFLCHLDIHDAVSHAARMSNATLCIPDSWKCDRYRDCPNGDDEKDCPLEACDEPHRFRCADGHCTMKRWVCDREPDCPDGSDELNCPNNCTEANHFACASGERCIPDTWKCDGEPDCYDHSDEQNCSTIKPIFAVTCDTLKEFQCTNSECIPHEYVCDGAADCDDSSDEENCSEDTRWPRQNCTEEQFRCTKPPVCIPIRGRCDGTYNCRDGSDETNCETTHGDLPVSNACAVGTIPCLNHRNQCIANHRFCDGTANCPDGWDEANCDWEKNPCSVNNGGCEGKCFERKSADGDVLHFCACDPGFTPDPRNKSHCIDEDECKTFGMCTQICKNKRGSYHCTCHAGYILQKDGRTCRALGQHPKLIYADDTGIRQYDLREVSNRSPISGLLSGIKRPVALDYLEKDGIIIYSSASDESQLLECTVKHLINITKAKHRNISSYNEVVQSKCVKSRALISDGKQIEGAAIDWVNYRVYVTDLGKKEIRVVDMDGRFNKTLLTEKDGLSHPRGIAVDPDEGLMFWCDWDVTTPRIEVAGMDGGHRRFLFAQNDSLALQPNGIALDTLAKRVYWVDPKLRRIASTKYDGSDYRVIVEYQANIIQHPFDIAVFEDRVYWSDWHRQAIMSADKFSGRSAKALVRPVKLPMALAVSHRLHQREANDLGRCFYHKCMYMCLPTNPSYSKMPPRKALSARPYTCVCPDGVVPPDGNPFCVGAYVGDETEPPNPKPPAGGPLDHSGEPGHKPSIAGKVILVLGVFAGLIALALALVYRRLKARAPPAFQHFANPIYPGTTTADENGHGTTGDGVGGVLYEDALEYHPSAVAYTPNGVNYSQKAPLTEHQEHDA